MRRTLSFGLHGLLVVLLTVVTQLGGIAWIIALLTRRRVLAFLCAYVVLSVTSVFVAPVFGRTPLSCLPSGSLQMQSTLYCALNRHYVTPELGTVLQDMARDMAAAHPDTVTQVLDAGFPFWNGMPLLPHLSHNDGEKADIAFYYENENGYLRGQTRSPIGYFAFQNGPTSCPKRWPSLRWDMVWLQGFWPNWSLDDKRMATALRLLKNDPRVGKIFVEPHLARRYGATGGKVRFQGCRAARHDDHIHMQL